MSERLSRWLAAGVLAVFAAPILLLLYRAVAPGEAASLLRMAVTVLPAYMANTLVLAVLAPAAAAVIGTSAAWAVTFRDFPGRPMLDAALALPLALPPYLLAIVYRETAHRTGLAPLVESLGGAAAVFSLALYPYVYLLARAVLARQAVIYLEAGRALGVGGAALARRVLLPLAAPAAALGGLLAIAEVVGDFGTADILGVTTLTTAIHRAWFTTFDAALAAQLALVAAVLPLVALGAFLWLARGRAFHAPANRPRPPDRQPLSGPARGLVPLLCALPPVLGFVVPVIMLTGWAAQVFDRVDLSDLFAQVARSLGLAAGAAGLCLGVAALFALTALVARRGRAWRARAMAVVAADLAMPAMAMAMAGLFLAGALDGTAAGAWLGGTMALIILMVALRYAAFAYLATEGGLATVSPRLLEAARCAGFGPLGGAVRVLLPPLRGALTVGGLLVFVHGLKELTISLVLQPFGYESLAITTYHFAKVDAYQRGSVFALCLILIALYPVWSVSRWARGGRN